MPSGNSWTNLFGASPIAPANPSYEALTLTASVALVWPLETTGGTPYVASQIDVTASIASLTLAMPPANTGSNGGGALITNVGANTFTVTDTAGNQIVQIATTQTWLVTLIDNTTVNGSWRAYQLAATTSSATAAALAGPGIQAIGSLLQTIWSTDILTVDTLITSAYRSHAVIWTAGAGALQLDSIANLTVGWFAGISNEGSGDLTISTTGGATINGAATFTLRPGNSGLIICSSGGFHTLGAVIGTLPISGGGTGATTASGALTNLGGTSIGKSIFTSPTAATVKALLGIQDFTLKEVSVNTNQVLTVASSGTLFLTYGSPLTISLPLAATAGNTFFVIVAAVVDTTVTPQPSDNFVGSSPGVSYMLRGGGSLLIACNGDLAWVPVFGPSQSDATLGDIATSALPEALLAVLKPGWQACGGGTRPRTDPLWQATGAVNAAYWVWGNGDGTTTYTLPDFRGRVAIGKDDMGGVAANRITAGVSGINGVALGAAAGTQFSQQHSHTATNTDPGHNHSITDPGHNHSIGDPGHDHSIGDPGHTHSVADPAHMHGIQLQADGGGAADGISTSIGGALTAGGSTAAAGTGISINAAGTGITAANASVTGITGANANATGITGANANATGVTTAIANFGGGASQNVQPSAVTTMIIYTGA